MLENPGLWIIGAVAITNVLAYVIGWDRGRREMAEYCTRLVVEHNRYVGTGSVSGGEGRTVSGSSQEFAHLLDRSK